MSNNNLFEHQVIPQNSSTSPVENLAGEVATAFESVEKRLGTDTIYPSLNKVLGNFVLADVSYHGVSQIRSDTFAIGDSTKDLVLSYIPTDNIAVSYLDDTTQNTVYLVEKQPTQEFTGKNEFKRLGRVLVLSGNLSGKTVKVDYTGLEPTLSNKKLKPNVLKSLDGSYLKPLQELTDTTFSVTYDVNLQGNIAKYLNGNSTDKELIYLIAKKDNAYSIVNYDSLTVTNGTVTFTIDAGLEESYSEVLVYVLNVTVADLIEALYLEFKNHDHSKDSFESVVDHKNIVNSYQNSSKIFYKDSQTANYSHPQFLNREGYNTSVTSAYENAMLGDLFLAALVTDQDQVFKSLTKNSAKILFGDPVAGSKLYFDSNLKALNLLTGSDLNGLNITAGTGRKAFSINGDSTYLAEEPDHTVLKGKNNKFVITDNGNSLATLETKNLEVKGSANLALAVTQTLHIGNTNITSPDGISTVYSYIDPLIGGRLVYEAVVEYDEVHINTGSIKEVLLEDKITASENSSLENKEGSFNFKVNEGYVNIEQVSGKTSGIRIGSNGLYQKTYSSNYLGQQATAVDASFFTETSPEASVYFIKEPSSNLTYKTRTYSFQETVPNATRIDSLKDWIRSDVYAGDYVGYSITLDASDQMSRKGLKIGSTRLSVIGSGLDCPTGTTILESEDTIHFVKPLGSDTDVECSSISYQDVNVGALQVFGDASFDSNLFIIGDVTTGETVTTTDLVVNGTASITQFTVSGEATFSGRTSFLGQVEISNNVEITGAIDLTGSLSASDGSFSKFVSIGETLTVSGQSIFDDNVIVQGSLYTGESFTTQGTINAGDIKSGNIQSGSINAQGSITAIGSITAEGPGEFKGNIEVAGSINARGNIDTTGEITADSLYVTSDTTLIGRFTTEGVVNMATESFTVGSTNASLLMYGTLQVTGTRSVFSGDMNVQGNFVASSLARFGDDVEISGSLKAVAINISSNATVNGNLVANAGEFTRKVYFQDGFKSSGSSEFVDMTGSKMTLTETTTDSIYIRSTLSMGPDAVITAYKIESAQFVQKDAGAISTFAGEVKFNSQVTTGNEGIVVGNPDIKTSRNTSGCFITDNSIVLGNNSTIKAVKIFANKGVPSGGNRDLNAGFCFSSNLAQSGEDGDTGFFATTGSGSGLDGSDIEVWIDNSKKYVFYKTDVAYNANKAVYGKAVVTLEMLQAMQAALERKITSGTSSVSAAAWPVGSIFITNNDANPYTLFGFGTWVRYAAGRTLVGKVTNDDNEQGGKITGGLTAPSDWVMSQTGITYGSFKHKLTAEEIAAHAHQFDDYYYPENRNSTGSVNTKANPQSTVGSAKTDWDNYNTLVYTHNTENAGGDQPHNNVQPSIIVNMWNRIA